MIKRELMYCVLKVTFLFGCILFRILLGDDDKSVDNEVLLISKEVNVLEDEELIKDVTLELISNENIVCGFE